MLRKKAQKSGAGAAALIGIITLILIGYILFLPAEEREELLEDTEDGLGVTVSGKIENVSLLNVTALRLEFVGENDVEHDIPNIYLFETTEADVIEQVNPFSIRNGWFDKRTKNVTFYIDNLALTEDVALSFEAPKAKGNLKISLNGAEIFDYATTQLNVGPVQLRKELLKEGKNIMFFETAGVGIKFWSTNEYNIEDLKITGDIKDVGQQASVNTFTVTNEEYYNLEESYLTFYPICDPQSVGVLEVTLNNRVVFTGVPDCQNPNRQDIFATDLNPGKNTVTFRTTKGSYRIELIKVKTKLRDVKTFLDYFDINSSLYQQVRDNQRKVVLQIEFVDDREDKEAEINVNGHLTHLDQKDPDYSKDISSWIEEGTRNYVEIKPKTVLKIREINVVATT